LTETTPAGSTPLRDHLFLSYAGEDGALAEWLTLKLVSEGYRVWCDRVKLLGGESYPKDISTAIRERTFRFVPLLSHYSVAKENPLKERTLAQAVSRERHEEFILPINVDGIKPHELDFQSADLVYIAFHESWSRGLGQLLKKLQQISAPRDGPSGQLAVSQWLLDGRYVVDRDETLWSNLVPIKAIPAVISRFEFDGSESFRALDGSWPYFRQNSRTAWSFFPPPEDSGFKVREKEKLEWTGAREGLPFNSLNAVSHLLRHSVLAYCRSRGMAIDQGRGEAYFPQGLFHDGWLSYQSYGGAQTRVKVVGERTFKVPRGIAQKSRYHLEAAFDPFLGRFGKPVFSVSLGVYWTDLHGIALPAAAAQRRRKALCKTWWNHEWLSRLTALLTWLSEGKGDVVIAQTDSGNLVLGGRPIQLSTNVGIDEAKLLGEPAGSEVSELEDTEEEDESEAIDGGPD
jgi:TIR domain